MFIETLFVRGKTWKEPRCSPTGKWSDQLWNRHTQQYKE